MPSLITETVNIKLAIYSQLSLAKKTLKWLHVSTVRMVVICLTIREKSYFMIYHAESVGHYFLRHFGIFYFSWFAFIKM